MNETTKPFGWRQQSRNVTHAAFGSKSSRLVRFKKFFDKGWMQARPGYCHSIWPEGKVVKPCRRLRNSAVS